MKKSYLFLFILVFTSLFIHFYKLSTIPPGLSNDEANIGYEAWSIATIGKDQWGRPWPLTFEGFGNWSLPVYIYLTASLIRFFGPTAFAVRLLSAVSGVTIVVLTYFVVRRLRPQSLVVALGASALVATTPWIIGLTRTATEAPLAMAFFMAGLYFGHSGVIPTLRRENDRISIFKRREILSLRSRSSKTPSGLSPRDERLTQEEMTILKILLSGFLTLLSLFTYYGMWVFVPMYLAIVLWFSRKRLAARLAEDVESRRVSRKPLWVMGGIGVVGGFGILWIAMQQGGVARLRQVNLAGNPTIIGMLNEERGVCERIYPSSVCQLVFNRATRYGSEFVRNYLSHFSLREWFLTNDAKGILPSGGYFFAIVAPMFVIGLFQLFVNGKREERIILLSWIFLAPLADSLTGAGNFSRAFPMAPIVAIIAAYSVMVLPRFVLVIFFGIFTFALAKFFLLYTSYFPVKHSPFTHYEYQPLVSLLKDEHRLPLYISSAVRDTKQYVFYLWYAKIPPQYFQESMTVVRESDLGGWVWVKQVDNWHFVKRIPEFTELPTDAIVIGAWKEEVMPFVELLETCNDSPRSLQTIEYLNGDPAFAMVHLRRINETFCLVQ